MSVWLCIPSKRPVEEAERVLSKWREMGYRIAIQVDPIPDQIQVCHDYEGMVDFAFPLPYLGYANAVNWLVAFALAEDPSCDWIVAAGDDTLPDPNKRADEIAAECGLHFGGATKDNFGYSTFGVMQPTGDRTFGDKYGPYIDRVAGSPWMGREWCLRINQGKGPLWSAYFHMGCDEELQEVAMRYGVFWQRPDLTHYHEHWGRPREGERIGQVDRRPAFLERANSQAEWRKYKKLFAERQRAGFPGSEPL